MSQMHLSCPRRPLAPRIDLLIGGMFIDGNIFHCLGLAGIRANLYLGGRRVQKMVIYVGLKYGVEKEDPGSCRVTGDGKWMIRNSGIRRPCPVDREN
ncbi:hypothetical protein CDAR_193361 [Caerostris darwini]|uniref:Uncharacterized protein n=1 Tax=Caerostris darwini TaxID=1538125 RepID=A0AAV4S4Z4_9ARAC|nr:hypothetical protein CDAR_193361 [Caerostris darwini]